MIRQPQDYIKLRDEFDPRDGRLGKCCMLIVAESPPASGYYFYDTEGRTSSEGSNLFSEVMKVLNLWKVDTERRSILQQFSDEGYFLLDVTYTPVNKMKPKDKEKTLVSSIPRLLDEIRDISPDCIIIIKTSIYSLVKNALIGIGYREKVLHESPIPFPTTGHQVEFRSQFLRAMSTCPCLKIQGWLSSVTLKQTARQRIRLEYQKNWPVTHSLSPNPI